MDTANDIDIPRHAEQVSAGWMSLVLASSGPGTTVTSVELTPVGTGQAGETYRAELQYSANPRQLPETVVVKLSSERPEIRQKVSSGYRVEHAFYTSLAPRVHVPIPQPYFTAISDDSLDFVLVMADESPAEQGDQIEGASARRAQLAAEAIAGLHGPLWCDPDIAEYPHTVMPRPGAETAAMLGEVMKSASETALREAGHLMTYEDQVTFSAAAALTEQWLLVEPQRFSVLHGDYRVDNLLFTPDDSRISVVDWQSVTIGLPGRDLAYFAATSLLPELRAHVDRELVTIYHEALLAHGVVGYDWESCWNDYRLGTLQATMISGLALAFTPAPNERAERMVMAMLTRGCRAIRELDTLQLIQDKFAS